MAAITAEECDLPSLWVDVSEPGSRGKSDWLRCEIDRHLSFDTRGLESYCLASWESVVYDAFLLAAAVQFCDQIKRRPARSWGRKIYLRVPVHSPDLWRDEAVNSAFVEALNALTGDCWSLSFKPRRKPISRPRQQPLNLGGDVTAIIPFSNGMDSLAVAGLVGKELGDKLIRVRLGSGAKKKKASLDRDQAFAAVPYKVYPGQFNFVETSGRSRGFKFMMLSGLAAYLSGAQEIVVPESGQGALGPWLVEVGQAQGDTRNHPRFTRQMEKVFHLLLGHHVRFRFPRLWYTKGETLAEFISSGAGSDRWAGTWSCWQGPRQASVNGKLRQCGICAACLLRRLSVHAAGQEEDPSRYVWERLDVVNWRDGAAEGFDKFTGALWKYTVAGVLHLDHLADLVHSPLARGQLRTKAFHLSRDLDIPESDVEGSLERLFKKHDAEWSAFVDSLGPQSFVSKLAKRGASK